MRLLGFILGVLLILGLIRLFFPFDVNLSSWMAAWNKPSGQARRAVLLPPAAPLGGDRRVPGVEEGDDKERPPPDHVALSDGNSASGGRQEGGKLTFESENQQTATFSPHPLSQQTPSPRASGSSSDAQGGPFPTPVGGKKWQPFWKPFSTLGSAQGFARNIAEKTGLEVKPRQLRPGLYEVVFSYGDEGEKIANARLIEGELGLKLESPDPGP